jgi:hypothetical protein
MDRRRSDRRSIIRDTTLRDPAQRPVDVLVRDVSADGFCVDTDHPLDIDDIVSVGLIGIGSATARVVRRTAAGYGCAFLHPLGGMDLQRAFAGTTVTDGAFASVLLRATSPGEQEDRWTPAVRAITLVGSALACWVAIAGAMTLIA